MINRKILFMTMFSLAAHLAVAAVIVYTPYDMTGNSMAGHQEKVIWGIVQGSEKSATEGKVVHATNLVQQNKIIPNDISMPASNSIAANTDETPMSTRLTEDDVNPAGHPELVSVSQLKPGDEILKQVQNDRVEGNKCSTLNDCGTVSITTGNADASGSSYDIKELAEYVRIEIEKRKYYPDFAKLRGIEGTVYINFYIGQDGTPSGISVARSSGSRLLDEAGIKTIGLVEKFSNLHKELRELDIVVPITYKLGSTDK